MTYRLDELIENRINPITEHEYDSSWAVLILDDSEEHRMIVGRQSGCAYTIRISRSLCIDWKLRVGDFIQYNEANLKNSILVMSENDYQEALSCYEGHSYNEPFLRDEELKVLVHSTTMEGWHNIQRDGCLKCWNLLKSEHVISEDLPIGQKLGDPIDFSDYIMFGRGVTTEIVVNSKQSGDIVMDRDAEYITGARLYFDVEKMAKDGLLIRDGCHTKVKYKLPLEPYLIWASTWDKIGLPSQVSTPNFFADTSDDKFEIIHHYDLLIDENNDPVHDPKPLQDYMNKWDGQAFIDSMELSKEKSVLEIGVGTGRLAVRVAPLCGEFYGIDISPKTTRRAKENLAEFTNVRLICADFLSYEFDCSFDVVYSCLTFMHFEDKQRAVNKIAGLLKDAGRFVLSIDKNPSEFIDTGIRKIKIYPDTPYVMAGYIKDAGLTILNQYDTEFASVFVTQKG